MMSAGTAFAYLMGVCFLCSILGLVFINLCAVADFVINSRRGDEPCIKELEREEDTSRYSMFLLVCRMLLLASLIPASIICSRIEERNNPACRSG
mgnify:CR=1 FL=1